MHETMFMRHSPMLCFDAPVLGDVFYCCLLMVVATQSTKLWYSEKYTFPVYNLKRLENPAARCLS